MNLNSTYKKPPMLTSIEKSIFKMKQSICQLEIIDKNKVKEFDSKKATLTRSTYQEAMNSNPVAKIASQQKNLDNLSQIICTNLQKLKKFERDDSKDMPLNNFLNLKKNFEKMNTEVLARVYFTSNPQKQNAQQILGNDLVLQNHSVLMV
jgi:hypothetical protein